MKPPASALHFIILCQVTFLGLGAVYAQGFHRFRNGLFLTPANDAVSATITDKQITQTRFNFGVNFGGCFLRERWMFPSLFPPGTNTELEATLKAASEDREKARLDLENHWKNYVLDDDWDWLQANRVNSVRVPIVHAIIGGGEFTSGTRFEPVADIYVNAWLILKSHFVEPAARRGISILIDLHGLPGGANGNDHNGEQSGKADFWTNANYRAIAVKFFEFIAMDLKAYDNIAGYELVNEADFSHNPVVQRQYYKDALAVIRKHDKDVPVVISDGWWADQWVTWVQDGQGADTNAGVVVDHHVYRCFSDSDRRKSAEQIIRDLDTDLLTNLRNNGEGVDLMVGEWSCVIDSASWRLSGLDPSKYDDPRRLELVNIYGAKQEKLIEERAPAGSYFWSYKYQWGDGGEWGFRRQLNRSYKAPSILVPDDLTLDQSLQDRLGNSTLLLYREGFTTAWKDGVTFAKKGALIGRKQAVKHARRQQYIRSKGQQLYMKQWNEGFDKGLTELERLVRVG